MRLAAGLHPDPLWEPECSPRLGEGQWRHQKEEVGWALASMRQPNAEGVRCEAPRGLGAAGAETSAEGARVEAP